MKKCILTVASLALGFFFIACSSSYTIVYATRPSGALISCGGEAKGLSPYIADYDRAGLRENPVTVPCEALWLSGAKAYFPNKWHEVIKEHPDKFKYTLERPNVAGLDIDNYFVDVAWQFTQNFLDYAHIIGLRYPESFMRLHNEEVRMFFQYRQKLINQGY